MPGVVVLVLVFAGCGMLVKLGGAATLYAMPAVLYASVRMTRRK
jgi:hypothetical protein